MTHRINQQGIALVSVMVMAAALLALFAAYTTLTRFEQKNTRYSKQSVSGFYAAEAGLNMRAETIRAKFIGFNVPQGTSPSSSTPCAGGDSGTGDFACVDYDFNGRDVTTYVTEEPGNPYLRTIPAGEKYESLYANEYRYTTRSEAKNAQDKTEAQLELRLRNRTVPLFQFAVFYNKDLEINNGATMTLAGPVHTNGSLFVSPPGTNALTINGRVTVAGDLYRGRKSTNTCGGNANVRNQSNTNKALSSCNGSSRNGPLGQTDIDALDAAEGNPANRWNGRVKIGVPIIEVPSPGAFDAAGGAEYWDAADIRIVLPLNMANNERILDGSNPDGRIEIHTANGNPDGGKTVIINDATACPGILNGRVARYQELYDYREAYSPAWAAAEVGNKMRVLDVDVRGLLACMHLNPTLLDGRPLNEDTDGGLVIFLTVKGPRSATNESFYGVRLRNGANLRAASNAPGAPNPRGITVVSDQMAYIHGDYNASSANFRTSAADNVGYLPAAVMADAITVLSNSWQDSYNAATQLARPGTNCSTTPWRGTSNTTVNAAFLANTATTGDAEGTDGMDRDTGSGLESYNGGLENYPRLLEHWGQGKDCTSAGRTLTYRGSFVSLSTPQHTQSIWRNTGNYYNAPVRNWGFDTNFRIADNLPPRSPRFVYLKQELFVRDFEQAGG